MNATDAFRSLSSGIRFKKKAAGKPVNAAPPVASTSKAGSSQSLASIEGSSSNPKEAEVHSNAIRRAHKIRCTGEELPPAWSDFSAFPSIPQELLDNLANMGVTSPTPIQMQAPSIMLAGRDLLACAPTGSGKTLSFLLPTLLSAVFCGQAATQPNSPVAIVVEPTRELARQVYTEAAKAKSGTGWRIRLLGEAEADEQADVGDEAAVDLIVTTPLKLVFAIKEKTLDLSNVRHLILDEADRLFELGFLEQTDEVIAACTHTQLHKAMFSATVPSGVEELAKSVMGSDMIRVIIGGSDSANRTISQDLTFTGTEDGKLVALKNLIKSGGLTPPALIFVQSVERAQELNRELVAYNLKSESMHAERSKDDRDKIVQRFAEGKIWVLVCTDVMSRGIDFRGVELVINYDFPQSVQSYIHRIGRTGRAQRSGRAITFFTKDDASYLRSIVNVMRNSGCLVPDWMLQLKAPSQNAKKQLRRKPVERKDVSQAVGSIGGKRKGGHGPHRAMKKAKNNNDEVEEGSSDFSDRE